MVSNLLLSCQLDLHTITKSVFDLVYKPDASVFTVWFDIKGLFLDNEMQCAVLPEAEFCSIVQGHLSISDYFFKLKKLTGHPVSKPSQVLNLLRGLNKKFRHVKPRLTYKTHTFMSARSYLLLEELQQQQDDKTKDGPAFLADHHGAIGPRSANPGGSSGTSSLGAGGSSNHDNTSNHGTKSKPKRRGRGSNCGSASSGSSGSGAP
jgi:hypothetical protein